MDRVRDSQDLRPMWDRYILLVKHFHFATVRLATFFFAKTAGNSWSKAPPFLFSIRLMGVEFSNVLGTKFFFQKFSFFQTKEHTIYLSHIYKLYRLFDSTLNLQVQEKLSLNPRLLRPKIACTLIRIWNNKLKASGNCLCC